MRQNKYFEAYCDDFNCIVVYMSKNSYGGTSNSFYLQNDKGELEKLIISSVEPTDRGYNKYTCLTQSELEVGKEYHVLHQYARKTILKTGYIVKQPKFDECFAYDGDDLGATYSKKQTQFKIWAPTASMVDLNLNDKSLRMKRGDKGVYSITVQGDWANAVYKFYVRVDGEWRSCVDPYGKSSRANGEESIVIDLNQWKQEKLVLPPLEKYTDAIIYEMNVRDFTSQTQLFSHPKQFLGVIDENEETQKRHIGFTHLKELGVTHIQLMPVMDYASVDENHPDVFYNWGYDPAQYMTLEGSYSSDPNLPLKRIEEFKTMVDTCHRAGLRVNLDVVFNHVFELEDSCLQQIVPSYFFQMNQQGNYSNGTWCGNDFDSTRKMAHKYIVDCCRFLTTFYQIDGLRFDLMGILDIDTINEVQRVCQTINPSFMVYGEGWNMPSFLDYSKRATIINDMKMPHVAHFSDRFRDVVKGTTDMSAVNNKGYCTGNTSLIGMMKDVLTASVTEQYANRYFFEPINVVNYVECHDNQTCWDKIKECCKEDTREKRIQRHQMCIAATCFAQGIPFIHCGQEFARTKYGKPNTYCDNDSVNWVDWDRKDRYQEIVEYTKQCIQFRKEHACLRYATRDEILKHVSFSEIDGKCLCYTIKEDNKECLIIFNPTDEVFHFSFAGTKRLTFYNGSVEDERANGYIAIHALSVIALEGDTNA